MLDREHEVVSIVKRSSSPHAVTLDVGTASTAEAAPRAGSNGTAPVASLGVALGPRDKGKHLSSQNTAGIHQTATDPIGSF